MTRVINKFFLYEITLLSFFLLRLLIPWPRCSSHSEIALLELTWGDPLRWELKVAGRDSRRESQGQSWAERGHEAGVRVGVISLAFLPPSHPR